MDPLLIPLAALAIPIIVVPTALGFRHAAKLRDLDHAERMRAMELGRVAPCDEVWTVPAKLAAAIGVGVPMAALVVGFLASWTMGPHPEIWNAAGMIGVPGVLGGTYLASRYLAAASRPAPTAEKRAYDPDSFDFAGRG